MSGVSTRVYLYPEGEEGEIELVDSDGSNVPVPAVGDRVQAIDRPNGVSERGPMYEVVRREFYYTRYSATRTVAEVALYGKEIER